MNRQTEALKLALEALGAFEKDKRVDYRAWDESKASEAITAIREALAEQPAQQTEPCGWRMKHNGEWAYSFTEDAWDFIRRVPKAQQQEPVAVYVGETWCGSVVRLYEDLPLETPLYTSPPAQPIKPWMGLSDEEINACDPQEECWNLPEVARSIEAKLKEKNT